MRGGSSRSRGKLGLDRVTHRTGPLCTPAFAMTDQKSQGKQFSQVLLNLKGVHGSSTATRPSFMSLYVQLSRAERWEGLYLFRKPVRGDFIEPKNELSRSTSDVASWLPEWFSSASAVSASHIWSSSMLARLAAGQPNSLGFTPARRRALRSGSG